MLLSEKLYYFAHGLCCMFFLLAGVYLLRDRNTSRLRNVLGGVVLFWFILEAKDLLLYSSSIDRDSYFSTLLIMVDMWAVPACSFYLFELLSPGWINWKKVFMLEAFFIVCTLGYAITASVVWSWLIEGYAVLYLFVVIVILYFAVKRYNKYVHENYSYMEHLNVRWLRQVTFLMFICLSVWMYSCLYSSWNADSIYYFSSLLLWACILYYSESQETVPITGNIVVRNLFSDGLAEKKEEFILNGNLALALQKALEEDELFLNPKLTLTDLATAIGTNRTYLSSYLNTCLNVSFYDYINSYRMEKMRRILSDTTCAITMNEVAEMCGFNSLSTFRRTFVKEHGMTFSEYRKKSSESASKA